MLSEADNEILTRVGPGTLMGNLLRRYWLPALLSAQKLPEADSPPVRVRLLGEDLVAFRDTRGDVGLLAARLPAPRRVVVLRPQRRGRAALRLPRLEVRHDRRLCRHAVRACRIELQEQGEGRRRIRRTSPAASSGPTWDRRSTRRRSATSARTSLPREQWRATKLLIVLQLRAGDGRQPRHLAHLLPAPQPRDADFAGRRHRHARLPVQPTSRSASGRSDRAPRVEVQDDALRLPLRRAPHDAQRLHARAHDRLRPARHDLRRGRAGWRRLRHVRADRRRHTAGATACRRTAAAQLAGRRPGPDRVRQRAPQSPAVPGISKRVRRA